MIDSTINVYSLLHLGLSVTESIVLNKIRYQFKDKSLDRILITGQAGAGKTFVLKQVLQELADQEGNLLAIDAENIDNVIQENFSSLDLQDKILIIDGLDEIFFKNYKEYYAYIEWLIASCSFCIASIRVPIDKKYLSITSSFNSIIDFDSYSHVSFDESLIDYLLKETPIDRKVKYQALYKNLDIKEKEFEKILAKALEETVQVYDESGQILLYNPAVEIPQKEIILPSREIITGINVLQASLVEAVQHNPEFIYEMSSRQFEELVAEMYEKQGYSVELTKMTRDGGKDLILYTDGPTGHNMFYVECKKHRKSHLVDVGIVRNFYGVVEADKATAGILVTSSSFTPDARSFEKQVFHRMTLVDYIDLLNQVTSIMG